jgi:hypothetical protein
VYAALSSPVPWISGMKWWTISITKGPVVVFSPGALIGQYTSSFVPGNAEAYSAARPKPLRAKQPGLLQPFAASGSQPQGPILAGDGGLLPMAPPQQRALTVNRNLHKLGLLRPEQAGFDSSPVPLPFSRAIFDDSACDFLTQTTTIKEDDHEAERVHPTRRSGTG